ncbi:MAG: hypothetical protein GF308_21080 [Candidatus Heimdallarchaeota archaeon]|nr:hypothetical protein [Candidatus Heimdallarchaeota archaeon]
MYTNDSKQKNGHHCFLRILSENTVGQSNLRVLSKFLRKRDPILGWIFRNESQLEKMLQFDFGFHGDLGHQALLLRSLDYLSAHSLYKKFEDIVAMHQIIYVDATNAKKAKGLEGHFKADLIIIRPGRRFIWVECRSLTRSWDDRFTLLKLIQKRKKNPYEVFFFHTVWAGEEQFFEHHPQVWEIVFPEEEKNNWLKLVKELGRNE